MKFEILIARRLKIGSVGDARQSSTPSLGVAVFGMTLAIVIMILSITVVCGFKREISQKIYALDSHIKVRMFPIHEKGIAPNDYTSDIEAILDVSRGRVENISIVAEKSAILKTSEDFKGVIYKGVNYSFNWDFLQKNIIDGRIPDMGDSANVSEVLISKKVANQLKLKVGDKIYSYFIDQNVKVRNALIVGIYNTDLEDFDNTYIIGNIRQIQSVNKWAESQGDYISVNCKNISELESVAQDIRSALSQKMTVGYRYDVSITTRNNAAYFTWLDLLDVNACVIIIIMLVVSAFTLIAAMLMIVLERINMIGTLKTLGADNGVIRKIFILLTNKLICKSLIYGNVVGIGASLLQQHFHILKLNAEEYYMPYVPIEINWWLLITLNIGILIISYISLLAPSHIVAKIEPNKSIKFE